MKISYWMHPVWITFAWALVAIASTLVSEDSYRLITRAPKYINLEKCILILVLLAVFAIGSALPLLMSHNLPRKRNQCIDLVGFLSNRQTKSFVFIFFLICLGAYLVWFGPIFSLTYIKTILVNGVTTDRALGNTIPGITTLTQLGLFLVTLCSYVLSQGNSFDRKSRIFYRRILVCLYILAIYRVFLWSERLALIEILVPSAVFYFCFRVNSKAFRELAPFFAIVTLIVIFGFFESFRSWTHFRESYDNIVTFSTLRLSAYYFSAFNNFAMMTSEISVTWSLKNTLQFLYSLPVPFNPLLEDARSQRDLILTPALTSYTHAEFNLFSGIGMIYLDVGYIFGSFVIFTYGYISGWIFVSFRNGTAFGLLIYPIWLIGLLDFGRILYWPSGRAFPAWILAAIFLSLFISYRRKKLTRVLNE